MDAAPVITKAPAKEAQRLRMTYEEFLDWVDEGVQAEWVNGEVIVFMPPKTVHQTLANFVSTLLTLFVEFFGLGQILTAPYEMKVYPEGSSREPDLLFIARENLGRLTENKLEGPADLIVEIISNDSVSRDRSDKFYEYQEAGIPEYWVLDSRPGKERADFWVLDEQGSYRPIAVGDDGIYRSTVIPGFWLRIDWLWGEAFPNPLLTFAEITNLPSQVTEALREVAANGLRNLDN